MSPPQKQPDKRAYWFLWLGWVLIGVGAEVYALVSANRDSETFSETVRRWVTCANHPATMPTSAVWAFRVLILAFFAWLGPHLAFGIWG